MPDSMTAARARLCAHRLELLVRQINARAEAAECDRELAAIERRLEMIDSVEAAAARVCPVFRGPHITGSIG